MLLHSIVDPLFIINGLQTMQQSESLREQKLTYGVVSGRETEDGFVIERVISTDLSDYLIEGNKPGKIYKKQSTAL